MNPPGLYIISIIHIKAIVFRVGESYLRMVGVRKASLYDS